MKKTSVRFFLSLLIILAIFQLTSGCFTFRMSNSEVNDYFAKALYKPTIDNYKVGERQINYASLGADTLPTVIFFHGAPGSWSAFIDYFKNDSLLHMAKLIAVDRPGFGYSNLGNSEPSLDNQALLLKHILEVNASTPTILVGHSLGGPIIAKLAMNYPDLVNGLIMIAPSVDPELEPDEDWFRMPLHTPFLRWILPASLRVTNDEIYFLENELKSMSDQWKNIEVPVTVIHGYNDKLVPVGNASCAKTNLINAEYVDMVLIEDMNHFIPWSRPDLVNDAILKHLETKKALPRDNASSSIQK